MTDQPARYVTSALDQFGQWGDRLALRHGDRRLSFADLLDTTHRTARVLIGHGLRRGDGLVLLAANPPEVQITGLAAHVLGVRYTPVYLGASVEHIAHVLADAAPAAVIVDAARLGARSAELSDWAARAGVRTVFSLGPVDPVAAPWAARWVDLRAAVATASAEPVAVRAQEDDIARILYTGGTTGKPKGVAYTFAALTAATAPWGGDLPPNLRFLAATPIAHAAGAIGFGLLRAGASVHLFDDFDAGTLLAELGRAAAEGASAASYLYPPYLYQLLDHPDLAGTDLSALRFLVYGSAPMSPSRLRQAIDHFGPLFRQGYAQTEAIAITGMSPADHALAATERPELLGSVGRPIPGVGVRIQDAAGAPLPAGEPGEVWVSGPTVMAGYWNLPELTDQVLVDGWLNTGDLGYLDGAGYLYLVGRSREIIVVDGHNCYAQPIENALTADPEVAQAAVFGVPDERTGEAVVAVVRVTGARDPERLRERVANTLGAPHVPAVIEFVDEMPTASYGKPDKRALKARLSLLRTDRAG